MQNELKPDRRRNIWIVDDSPTDSERVRQALASKYDIETFNDGAAALERIASGISPDLLMLDWVMPGISGVEVCQYIRSAQDPKLSRLPIILLTARYGSEEISQAFKSGANDYIVKPFIDLELKARVGALLESRRYLERADQAEADKRALMADAPDAIFAVDAQGNISYLNEEALRVLGRTRNEEVIGRSISELIPSLNLRNIGTAPGESLLPLSDVQIENRTFSPSVRILPSDNAASTTVSLRDVTARRQSEARRLDFYSIIAHDLRTPITSVLLRLQMLQRGRHGILPAGMISDLRSMETSLRSQVGMINDFLELAKFEGVGYKIQREPVDLSEVIRVTMEDFQPLLEKNCLHWNATGLTANTFVLGDRDRLAQVISNLVGNAIKFTPSAGLITTTVNIADHFIEATVQDSGRGISQDQLPHLFDRFTQANNTANETPGTGLGLMIVREIVEAHGGTIGVESELNLGSKFWFRIPRYEVGRPKS